MLQILEIGCGIHEWHLRQQLLERFFHPTPFSRKIAELRAQQHIYICLDTQLADLVGCRRHKEERLSLKGATTVFVQGSGTKLPFDKETLDYVIMSDVLTTPPHSYCSCRGGPRMKKPGIICKACKHVVYPGISEEDKATMINEALRTLKIGGELILGLYQSHQHAMESAQTLARLVRKGVIKKELDLRRTPIPKPYFEQSGVEISFLKQKTSG